VQVHLGEEEHGSIKLKEPPSLRYYAENRGSLASLGKPLSRKYAKAKESAVQVSDSQLYPDSIQQG